MNAANGSLPSSWWALWYFEHLTLGHPPFRIVHPEGRRPSSSLSPDNLPPEDSPHTTAVRAYVYRFRAQLTRRECIAMQMMSSYSYRLTPRQVTHESPSCCRNRPCLSCANGARRRPHGWHGSACRSGLILVHLQLRLFLCGIHDGQGTCLRLHPAPVCAHFWLGIQQPVEGKLPMVVSGICRGAFGTKSWLCESLWRQG